MSENNGWQSFSFRVIRKIVVHFVYDRLELRCYGIGVTDNKTSGGKHSQFFKLGVSGVFYFLQKIFNSTTLR